MLAERVGFEPTVHETCTPVFETGTLNHSDTSPLRKARRKFTAMPTIVKKAVNRGEITDSGLRSGVRTGRPSYTRPPQQALPSPGPLEDRQGLPGWCSGPARQSRILPARLHHP